MGEPGLQTTTSAADLTGNADAWIEEAFDLLKADTASAQALASRTLAAAPPDSAVAGQAHHVLGMASCLLGQVPAGCEHLRLASKLLDRHGPAHAAGRAWRDLGSVLTHLAGDLPGGLTAMERALAIIQTLGDRHEEGMLLARLGPVLGHAGRHEESRRMLERAVALLADCPDTDARASALDNLGCQYLLSGDHAGALPLFRAERSLRELTGDRLHLANCDANLAIALAGTGQDDEARALLADLVQRLDPATDGHQWIDYQLTAGRVALLGGRPQDALAPLQDGLLAAREQGLHRIEIELLEFLAQAQEATGDLRAALHSERTLRAAERQWLDAQSTARLQGLESDLALSRERAERQALEQARAELEQRFEARTAELQDQMRERESADRANQAKSEFLSSMSHELRTPLNAILGFGQLMEYDDSLPADHHDNVKEILKAGRHLLGLINEVLDLAKVESGHIDLSLEPVELAPVVDECIGLLTPLAALRGIALGHERLAGAAVRADRTRLKQALLNLLSNAVKYNREGGTVRLDLMPAGADRLRIRVTDSGSGISAGRLAELFQPFNRLGAEGGEIEGTGIGLTITRRIVELMGGTVGVASEVGVGSCFWIELPQETQAAAYAAPAGFARVHAGTAESAGPAAADRHTVLYIEDNPANLKLVAQILAHVPNIHLLTAHTPSLGIELALARRPALILLDINMPGMDGYQVLRELRAEAGLKDTPVIAITANAMPRDVERGLAAGFSDYMTKPLDVSHFMNTVNRCLAGDAP